MNAPINIWPFIETEVTISQSAYYNTWHQTWDSTRIVEVIHMEQHNRIFLGLPDEFINAITDAP
jgi:hypothetical protein